MKPVWDVWYRCVKILPDFINKAWVELSDKVVPIDGEIDFSQFKIKTWDSIFLSFREQIVFFQIFPLITLSSSSSILLTVPYLYIFRLLCFRSSIIRFQSLKHWISLFKNTWSEVGGLKLKSFFQIEITWQNSELWPWVPVQCSLKTIRSDPKNSLQRSTAAYQVWVLRNSLELV